MSNDNREPILDFEPHAASEYTGDRECQYDGCDETADWLVGLKAAGYTGGKGVFCCQSCSEENRLYAEINDLHKHDVDEKLAKAIPDEEVQYVRDFQGSKEGEK